jgi:hypothetical protein
VDVEAARPIVGGQTAALLACDSQPSPPSTITACACVSCAGARARACAVLSKGCARTAVLEGVETEEGQTRCLHLTVGVEHTATRVHGAK